MHIIASPKDVDGLSRATSTRIFLGKKTVGGTLCVVLPTEFAMQLLLFLGTYTVIDESKRHLCAVTVIWVIDAKSKTYCLKTLSFIQIW